MLYYQQDKIKVIHADCFEILPKLDNFTICLTDPPYNVGLAYSDGDKKANYLEWSVAWFELVTKRCELLAFTPGVINQNMWHKIAKPTWIGQWVKTNQCASTALGGFNAYEPIFFYGKKIRALRQDVWIFPVKKQPDVGNHPCPKLLPMWAQLLKDISKEGCTVFDPFAGVGTTLLAAKKLGLEATGIDHDDGYCELTKLRLEHNTLDFELK